MTLQSKAVPETGDEVNDEDDNENDKENYGQKSYKQKMEKSKVSMCYLYNMSDEKNLYPTKFSHRNMY